MASEAVYNVNNYRTLRSYTPENGDQSVVLDDDYANNYNEVYLVTGTTAKSSATVLSTLFLSLTPTEVIDVAVGGDISWNQETLTLSVTGSSTIKFCALSK